MKLKTIGKINSTNCLKLKKLPDYFWETEQIHKIMKNIITRNYLLLFLLCFLTLNLSAQLGFVSEHMEAKEYNRSLDIWKSESLNFHTTYFDFVDEYTRLEAVTENGANYYILENPIKDYYVDKVTYDIESDTGRKYWMDFYFKGDKIVFFYRDETHEVNNRIHSMNYTIKEYRANGR